MIAGVNPRPLALSDNPGVGSLQVMGKEAEN